MKDDLSKKVLDLVINVKNEKLIPTSKEEYLTLEQAILADKEIFDPLIVWQGQDMLVDGHQRWKIYKAHSKKLPVPPIKEINFKDCQEVQVWIVEHHISRKSLTLWQKLEMAIQCKDYWKTKAEAKLNQGRKNAVLSGPDKTEKLDNPLKVDVNQIIADKVGCSKTIVTNFININKCKNHMANKIRTLCSNGDMSISTAYLKLNPPKKPNNDTSNDTPKDGTTGREAVKGKKEEITDTVPKSKGGTGKEDKASKEEAEKAAALKKMQTEVDRQEAVSKKENDDANMELKRQQEICDIAHYCIHGFVSNPKQNVGPIGKRCFIARWNDEHQKKFKITPEQIDAKVKEIKMTRKVG